MSLRKHFSGIRTVFESLFPCIHVDRGVTTGGGGFGGVRHPPPNLSKRYTRRAKTKKRSGKTTENLVEKLF